MLSAGLRKELRRVVGSEGLLDTEVGRLCYSYDAAPGVALPDAVVLPTSTEEVAAVVRLAAEAEVPIVPRGAGTNLSSGSLPLCGGLVVCTTRFARIREINTENLNAVVEPGVITAHLQAEVEELGLFYPPDPSSLTVSTLGGNLAESAGGPRGFKYGTTKDYALGLEMVLADGRVLRSGGRTVKNVSGYDLTHLFVGSEGTLGIITEATLRLIPLPGHKQTLLAAYDQIGRAAEAVSAIVAARIIPVTLEFFDNPTLRRVEAFRPIGLPLDADAMLLLEVDGTESEVRDQTARLEQILRADGVSNLRIARDQAEADEIWSARRSAYTAIVRSRPTAYTEDATVPRDRIPEMVRRLRELGIKYRVDLCIIGHAGDGNLHPTVMTDARDIEEIERVERFFAEVFQVALELGGTLTGEHGIGAVKAPYLEWQHGTVGVDAMRSIKAALDPKGLLNPGKMFGPPAARPT